MSPASLPLVKRPAAALVGASMVALALGAIPPSAPDLRAVASYDAGVVHVAGIRVLDTLPAVGMAVVEGSPQALARLGRTPGVRGVAPDVPVHLTGTPSRGTAVAAAQGLGGQAGKESAGRGVRIAVLDTGVSDTAGLDRRSGRLVDVFDSSRGASGTTYDDAFGHGTFMASIAAGGPADGSHGKPVGVAPGATVLVVRVAQPDGTTSLSQVLAGLNWVVGHSDQVDVANLSFSYDRPGRAYGADPLTAAVEAVRDKGVTVVVSAGNKADRVGDPGFAPRALTVGAADLTGRQADVAEFSGSALVAGVAKPDVVANGVSVLGVLPAGSVIARANPDSRAQGALWTGSGTSQATAVTTGVVALLLQKHPDATPAEVKALLRGSVRPLPGSRDGAGLLRLARGQADGADEPGAGPGGSDPTGEGGFDANSWSANSWSANSWSANSWSANSWSANSWSANSWSANSWSANSWSADSWSIGATR